MTKASSKIILVIEMVDFKEAKEKVIGNEEAGIVTCQSV
jgi:hypothetical protein